MNLKTFNPDLPRIGQRDFGAETKVDEGQSAIFGNEQISRVGIRVKVPGLEKLYEEALNADWGEALYDFRLAIRQLLSLNPLGHQHFPRCLVHFWYVDFAAQPGHQVVAKTLLKN